MMPTELSFIRRSAVFAFSVVVSLVLGAATANAVPIVSHVGSADPTTEGWSTVWGGANVSTSPVINDLGLGIDAWSVDDPTTATDSVLFYQFNPSPGVVGAAL